MGTGSAISSTERAPSKLAGLRVRTWTILRRLLRDQGKCQPHQAKWTVASLSWQGYTIHVAPSRVFRDCESDLGAASVLEAYSFRWHLVRIKSWGVFMNVIIGTYDKLTWLLVRLEGCLSFVRSGNDPGRDLEWDECIITGASDIDI